LAYPRKLVRTADAAGQQVSWSEEDTQDRTRLLTSWPAASAVLTRWPIVRI